MGHFLGVTFWTNFWTTFLVTFLSVFIINGPFYGDFEKKGSKKWPKNGPKGGQKVVIWGSQKPRFWPKMAIFGPKPPGVVHDWVPLFWPLLVHNAGGKSVFSTLKMVQKVVFLEGPKMAILEKLKFYYVVDDVFFGFWPFFFVFFWPFLSIFDMVGNDPLLGSLFWPSFEERLIWFLGQKSGQKWPILGHFLDPFCHFCVKHMDRDS